ncbi:MAG: hypothetical protein DDT24_00758 [Chloroflexi bacterium]|nr:hypothetical protein [Chloroflexota bacterium]
MLDTIKVQIMLHSVLGNPILREWIYGMCLVNRQVVRLSVDCSAGGGIDNPSYAKAGAVENNIKAAQNVLPGIKDGFGYRPCDDRLSCLVADDLRFLPLKDAGKPGITNAHLIECGAGIDVLQRAGGQIIYYHYLMPRLNQGIDQVRTDKSCPTGDQDFHVISL